LAALLASALLIAVAAARWVYTSPALNDVTSENFRKMVGDVLNPPTDKYGADRILRNIPNGAKPKPKARRKNRATTRANGSQAKVQLPTGKGFQVMDAQNLITIFPGYGNSESLPLSRRASAPNGPFEAPAVVPGEGTATLENSGTRIGVVSVEPSAEAPEKKVLPEYPAMALQSNVRGRVVLRAIIGKTGALQNVEMAGPTSLLSDAVFEAVKKWHYQPRYRDGVPVEVETQITMDFEINAR
jgi:TonB family protein